MMIQIKALIADGILEGVKSIAPQSDMTAEDVLGLLEYPPDPAMGDIALPCFKLAKTLRRSPVQIAATLAPLVSGEAIEKAEAVNGYLNIYLSGAYLANKLVPEMPGFAASWCPSETVTPPELMCLTNASMPGISAATLTIFTIPSAAS